MPELSPVTLVVLLVVFVPMAISAWQSVNNKQTETQRVNEVERNQASLLARQNETIEQLQCTIQRQGETICTQAAVIAEQSERLREQA